MSGGVSIKYNNNEIASMSSSGTKTLLTKGKYCNSDIQLDYEKPAPAVVPLHADEAGTYTPPTGKGYGSVVYSPEEITDAVRFLDYDGTILHQYTATQFLALSSMPSNPSHTGLTAQGWNWSLAEAQEYVSQWGFLDIGQMYVTSSGKTEIDIVLSNANLNLYLDLGINGEVQIEWGDGTTTTATGTDIETRYSNSHQYNSKGNYVLKINAISGTYTLRTSGTTRSAIHSNGSNTATCGPFYGVIRNVRIGNNVPLIGPNAFLYSVALKTITLPKTVSSLGTSSFQNCYSLYSIILPNNMTTINSNAFLYSYSLAHLIFSPSITETYNITSYSGNEALRCYIYPPNLSPVSTDTNYWLTRKIVPLAKVIYNDSFVVDNLSNTDMLGARCFSYCGNLTSINIPSTVTSIGSSAFRLCESLHTVTMSSNVTSISAEAFYQCNSLRNINLSSNLTDLGSQVFYSCYSLNSITIPSSVTSLGTYAFDMCYSLNSITIPSSVTSIEAYTFRYCYGLTSVTLPSTLTSIKNYAFSYCYSLFSITIPSSVTSIKNYAFSNCYGMGEYHFQSTAPPTLGTNVFQNIHSNCKIYVPAASLSAYQSATNWSTYASYMVGE